MFAAILAAAALQSPGTVDDLSWMAGYWLDCSEGREVSETWNDPRGGLMVGHAVTLENGRPSFEQALVGPTRDGGVAYYAQPGGRPPTVFVLVESGPGRAVFANPDNDFPTRIVYAREGEAMTARIEGQMDGRAAAMEWRFRRAELNARCPAA